MVEEIGGSVLIWILTGLCEALKIGQLYSGTGIGGRLHGPFHTDRAYSARVGCITLQCRLRVWGWKDRRVMVGRSDNVKL